MRKYSTKTNNKPIIAKTGKVGRPTTFTHEAVEKLESAFLLGCSIREACFTANINRRTFYDAVKKDPAMLERFRECQNNPIIKARTTIFRNLTDPELAKWYLGKKLPTEFGELPTIKGDNNTNNIGNVVNMPLDADQLADTALLERLDNHFNKKDEEGKK